MFNPTTLKALREYYVDTQFTSTEWVKAICRQILKGAIKQPSRDLYLFASYVIDCKYTDAEILRVFSAVQHDRISTDDHEHLLHLVHDRILKARRIRRIAEDATCPVDAGRYWNRYETRRADEPHLLSVKARRLLWLRDHENDLLAEWKNVLGGAFAWVRKHDALARRAKL